MKVYPAILKLKCSDVKFHTSLNIEDGGNECLTDHIYLPV